MSLTLYASPAATRRRKTRFWAFLVAATTSIATACASGTDTSTGPANGPAGVYTLKQIEQRPLPSEVFNGPYESEDGKRSYKDFRITITGGTLQLDDSGNYYSLIHTTVLKDGVQLDQDLEGRGTYTVKGNRLRLDRDNGVDWSDGTVGNGSVTVQISVVWMDGYIKNYTYTK